MNPTSLNLFLWGALMMGSLVVAAFFFQFWRRTRDQLFALFSTAFVALALNWLVLALAQPDRESRHFVYLIRLVAFLLISYAIIDKNRSRRR